jgi:hypothetical protein
MHASLFGAAVVRLAHVVNCAVKLMARDVRQTRAETEEASNVICDLNLWPDAFEILHSII